MDERKKKSVIQQIMRIAKNAADPLGIPAGSSQSLYVGDDANKCLLTDDTIGDFNKLVLLMIKEYPEWSHKFMDVTINNELGNLVGISRNGGSTVDIGNYLDGVISSFNGYNHEKTVYMPLGGIDVIGEPIILGKVTLIKMTNIRVSELVSRFRYAISLSASEDDVKEAVFGHMTPPLVGLMDKVCAEVKVIAEFDKASEIAEEEVRRTLDLLTYSVPTFFQLTSRISFGFLSEVNFASHFTPMIASDNTEFSVHSKRVGPIHPYVLSPSEINKLEELGVFTMAKVLEKPYESWTHFERTIMQSIRWFANAHRQRTIDDAILSLMNCMETCFTSGDKQQPVMNMVAEGVAFVLGNNLKERKDLKGQIKRLYGTRSDITHGREAHTSQADLIELSSIAKRVIEHLIKRLGEFKDKSALLEWIEDQRLS